MKWFYTFLIIVLVFSCTKVEIEPLLFFDLMEIPEGFPNIVEPDDNHFSKKRWALGKKLFFDPIMSSDSTVSCASCHAPNLAFSDKVALSLGVKDRIGTQNAPTLVNLAYHPYYTSAGGVPTLEMQTLVPIQEHNEFDFNILYIVERLKNNSTYVQMSNDAYSKTPDAFVITRSLANFERSLISGYSRYDQFENYNKNTLTKSERRGMDLFFNKKTNCSSCHSGFNFTNYAFENNGLYKKYTNEGRFRLTQIDTDQALFKVPTLRNIELTAPYMHDGSFENLEEVIEHYNTGGKNHPNKSELIQPLDLSNKEKRDLIAFLKSLTDESFIQNSLFQN
ncbi:MAG: cytochrome-c peroxidase [Saprospiraceae bacterium]